MARSHNDNSSITEEVKQDEIIKYKHHREGSFNCEAEVIEKGVLTCCLHDPITGQWKFIPKGAN